MDMVILQGTTGEWPSLSLQERLDMAAAWREAVPKGSRLKLILHVGHDSLKEAQALAEAAVALEMDAVLVSAPSKYIAHTARRKRHFVFTSQPPTTPAKTLPCRPGHAGGHRRRTRRRRWWTSSRTARTSRPSTTTTPRSTATPSTSTS